MLNPSLHQPACVGWGTLHDLPRSAALVPGLGFVNDLSLQHHRFPRSYFLSQQITHSSGEL